MDYNCIANSTKFWCFVLFSAKVPAVKQDRLASQKKSERKVTHKTALSMNILTGCYNNNKNGWTWFLLQSGFFFLPQLDITIWFETNHSSNIFVYRAVSHRMLSTMLLFPQRLAVFQFRLALIPIDLVGAQTPKSLFFHHCSAVVCIKQFTFTDHVEIHKRSKKAILHYLYLHVLLFNLVFS